MSTKIPDPIKIHPLIKFCRYSLLTAGILYGASRKKTLQAKEAGRVEEKRRKRVERAKRLEEEKILANERDLVDIIAIFTNRPISSFIRQTNDHGTQTISQEEMGGMGTTNKRNVDSKEISNGSKNVTNTVNKEEASGKCDSTIAQIYEDENKRSLTTPIDSEQVGSKTIEECDKNSTETGGNSHRGTGGKILEATHVGEVDITKDEE